VAAAFDRRIGGGRALPYGYIGPAVIAVSVAYVYPLVDVVLRSLQSQAVKGYSLYNYRSLVHDPLFRTSFTNNAKFGLAVPVLLVLGLVLALLLYEQLPGWRIHRALIFLPYVVAIPVAGIAFANVFAYRGPLNAILQSVGLINSPIDWLGNPATSIPVVAGVIVWREVGFVVVILLARLTSIDRSLLEAAQVDGATRWRSHRHITLPLLRPTLLFLALIELITVFSWIFSYVYTMTGGGPANSTSIIELYIWQTAFVYNAPGLASALAVTLLVLVATLVATQIFIRSRVEVY